MDAVRYWLAVFVVAGSPGVFLFWFSIHPFVTFWRRFDARWVLALHYAMLVALAAVIVVFRRPILSVDFGLRPTFAVLGLLLLVLAGILRFRISRRLSTVVLQGLPELDPQRYESRLVTEGLYARVRHPRYLQLALTYLAYASITNYLAVWIVFAVTVVWILLVVPVEERELHRRFGEEWERYRRDVPRLVPRLRRRRRAGET